MSRRDTPYTDMTDEEFVAELQSRLPERTWSMGHLLELERRGLEIVEHDADLHAALSEEFQAIQETIAKVAETFSATLEPLQEQLRQALASTVDVDQFRTLLPNLDRLVSPDFAKLPQLDTSRLMATGDPDWMPAPFDTELGPIEPSNAAPARVAWPAHTAEDILESRQLALEQANIAAHQLERLTETRDEIRSLRDEGRSPRPFDWWMLGFTIIAALGAAGAVALALL